jgi:hypothetical protein
LNAPTFMIIIIMVILLILAFRLFIYMLRRAVRNVIRTFRMFEATSPEKALPLESMGLRATCPLFAFRLLRDYRPYAIQGLFRLGIIRSYGESFYYLSEETLKSANLAI